MDGELHLIITALPAFYAIYLRRKLPDSPKFEVDGKPKQSAWLKIKEVWSKKYARRTLMLWIVWFMVVFSYYGMFLWLPSVMVLKGFSMIKSFGYVLIMTLAQLPGYFTAAWLIERAGRKFVLATYLLGTAASALVFGNAETCRCYSFRVHFYHSLIWVHGVHYMRIHRSNIRHAIRATGSGMAAAVGRIGGIFGPLLVGSLSGSRIRFRYNLRHFLWSNYHRCTSRGIFRNRNETIGIGMNDGPACCN